MKFLNFFKKRKGEKKNTGQFSDFFLNASEKEREAVLREAAKRSNEKQREILRKAQS